MEIAHVGIVMCLVFTGASGNQQSIYKELHDFVIGSSNRLVAPKKTSPISVGVQCGIVAINDVDREKNEIDVTRWGIVTWHSDLTWNSSDFSGLHNISVPYHQIWLPDLHLYNANSAFTFVRKPSAVLFDNGMQAVFSHVRSKVHCDNLAEDSCTLRIASWGSNTDIIRINEQSENPFDMNKIMSDEEFKGSRYQVLSYSYKKQTVQVANLPDRLDVMNFTFNFKEKNPPRHRQGPFRAVFQWS